MDRSSSSSQFPQPSAAPVVALVHHADGLVSVHATAALAGLTAFCQLREAADIGLALAGARGLVVDLVQVPNASGTCLAFLALLAIRAQEQATPLEVHAGTPVLGPLLSHLADAVGGAFTLRSGDNLTTIFDLVLDR